MRNNTLASQPQPYPVLGTVGSSRLGKILNLHLCSQPASHSITCPSIHISMHASISPSTHLLLSIQLFVYLSISSFNLSIYSTSCKEIQYRCSVLHTPRCKSKPMVSKYLEISCEKSQMKPYFQDCAQLYKRKGMEC